MLNVLQQKTFNKITNLDWKKVLRIQGMPGTGKSYVVGLALETLVLSNPELRIAVVAPTWQALCNIQSKTAPRVREKVTFKTVHSLLGQYPFEVKLGKTFFKKGSMERANGFDLIVVDEESMVNKSQSQLLLATRKETKILTMGDDCQLSAVMAKAQVFHTAEDCETIELTELVRNGGEIARISIKCRTKVFYPEKSHDNVLVHDDQESLVREFIKKVKTSKSVTDCIYLAFTNERVRNVSDQVHAAIYGKNAYNVGQFLRMEQNLSTTFKGSNVEIVEIVDKEKEVCGLSAWQVMVKNESGDLNLLTILDRKAEEARQARLRQLEELSEKCKDFKLQKIYRREHNELTTSFNAVSNPLVLTINKSQGITVKYVFVDTKNVKDTRGGKKKELLCVAYSRASVETNTVKIEIPFSQTEEYQDVRRQYKKVIEKVKHGSKLHWEIVYTCQGIDLRQHSGRVRYLAACKKFNIEA